MLQLTKRRSFTCSAFLALYRSVLLHQVRDLGREMAATSDVENGKSYGASMLTWGEDGSGGAAAETAPLCTDFRQQYCRRRIVRDTGPDIRAFLPGRTLQDSL